MISKDKRNAEWEKEKTLRELEKPNPYLAEMTLLEQTIEYCKQQLGGNEKEVEEEEEIEHTQPDGARVLVSKKDRDTEMYIVLLTKGTMLPLERSP